MSDNKSTVYDELDDAIVTDDSNADESSTEDSSSEGEDNQTGLDLESTQTRLQEQTTAQVEAQKMEDAWYAKVLSGKSSLDKVPAWLHPRVESRLNTLMGRNEDLDAKLEKKAQEIVERQKFDELKSSLPVLTKEQKETLLENYKELEPLGKLKALEKAIALSGIKQEKVADRSKARLPATSNAAAKKISNDPKSIAQDDDAWRTYLDNVEGYQA